MFTISAPQVPALALHGINRSLEGAAGGYFPQARGHLSGVQPIVVRLELASGQTVYKHLCIPGHHLSPFEAVTIHVEDDIRTPNGVI